MLRHKFLPLSLIVVTICLLSACGASPTPTSIPTVDPQVQRGKELFGGKGRCATCHALAPDAVILGPSLNGNATRAETRIAGWSARDYIEESILNPDGFKVPGFENAQMDVTIAKQLTVDELNDLVAFLLTLR